MSQETLRKVNDFLAGVKHEQRKWVIERLQTKSDAAAARNVGINPTTGCRWENKPLLDWAVTELLKNPQEQAVEILTVAVVGAARAKLEGLKIKKEDGTETWHQGIATEVLNRVLGTPVQRSEVSGPKGGPIEIEDATNRLLEAIEGEVEAPLPESEEASHSAPFAGRS